MLPKSGSLTSVKLLSLLYSKLHRMTLVGNSPASFALPLSFLPSSFFLSLPFVTVSVTSFGLWVLDWPASLPRVISGTLTSPVNPPGSLAPFLPFPSFLQSLKHRLFPLLIYFLPTPPFPCGLTHALLYSPKTVTTVSTKTTPSQSLPVLLFSTSLSFLTRCTDQRSLRYLPLSHSLLNVLSDFLSSPDVFVSGQSFSQAWTWMDKSDWIHPLRKQATHLTLTWSPPPPSKDHIFTEWAEDRPRLPRHDPRRLYPTFN